MRSWWISARDGFLHELSSQHAAEGSPPLAEIGVLTVRTSLQTHLGQELVPALVSVPVVCYELRDETDKRNNRPNKELHAIFSSVDSSLIDHIPARTVPPLVAHDV